MSLSKEDLHELLYLRQLLEPVAARESCIKYNNSCLDTMRRLNLELNEVINQEPKADIDDLIRLSREFHFTLYHGSRMPFLCKMISSVWQRLSPYMYFLAGESKTYKLSDLGMEPHLAIIEAYEARDPDAVAETVHRDIAHSLAVPVEEFENFKAQGR